MSGGASWTGISPVPGCGCARCGSVRAPREIACTSLYLDDQEWDVLCALPAKTLTEVRHLVTRGGMTVAIDELEDGTLLAEIDDQDGAPALVPGWLDVLRDITDDERWTGARLAR
jgi:CYTH domain-containing protein